MERPAQLLAAAEELGFHQLQGLVACLLAVGMGRQMVRKIHLFSL
jgi:hypothetical protein